MMEMTSWKEFNHREISMSCHSQTDSASEIMKPMNESYMSYYGSYY